MKFIFIILIASIFPLQGHSYLSVVLNREKRSLDVYVYATDKGKISVRLYNAYDNMVDEVNGEKTNLHFETSFDFKNRPDGIYTVIADLKNEKSLKRIYNVKRQKK